MLTVKGGCWRNRAAPFLFWVYVNFYWNGIPKTVGSLQCNGFDNR
jgi:hypothetical protein